MFHFIGNHTTGEKNNIILQLINKKKTQEALQSQFNTLNTFSNIKVLIMTIKDIVMPYHVWL
jgi:hypothetical protein